nr:FAD-dependent monooxygenase [Nocardia sp. MH4]
MRQGVYPHAWWDVYSALRDAVDAEPLVSVIENAHVVEIGQDADAAWARLEDGTVWTSEVLLGADGYRSVVRRAVDAARPVADYAGYVVWLGQSELPESFAERAGGPDFFNGADDMLAVYPLIDRDGGVTRYGWGWFDPHHTSLFRRIGAIDGTEVKHTPRGDAIPDEVYDEMIRTAQARWHEPWRTGVVEAFRSRDVVATPITEYLPHRVVDGRIGLLGDAAHAQTPMTGAGFEEAVTDAVALAEALDDMPADKGLARYESARLTGMRARVSAASPSAAPSRAPEQVGEPQPLHIDTLIFAFNYEKLTGGMRRRRLPLRKQGWEAKRAGRDQRRRTSRSLGRTHDVVAQLPLTAGGGRVLVVCGSACRTADPHAVSRRGRRSRACRRRSARHSERRRRCSPRRPRERSAASRW